MKRDSNVSASYLLIVYVLFRDCPSRLSAAPCAVRLTKASGADQPRSTHQDPPDVMARPIVRVLVPAVLLCLLAANTASGEGSS
jgi:hypothetical protein